MYGSSRSCTATSSSSDTVTAMSAASIKQEVIDNDSPKSAVCDSGEAAAVAVAAAVQRHFRLGLNSPPSVAAGRRSALSYSAAAATGGAGPRSVRVNANAQPETCVCEVCHVELGRYEALFCHKLLHFNSGNVCYVCDLYFAGGADDLRVHVATHHRDIAGLHTKASDTAFVCSVCVQRFSTSKALVRHQAQLHSPAVYSSPISAARKLTCAICTVDFANERELLSHLLGAQHKDMKIKLQSIFICIDCRSIFSNRDAYAFHMMTRAQNETCDVISAAAAAAKTHSQNGDVIPSLSTSHKQGQQQSTDTTSTSPPHARNHCQSSFDVRRALTDTDGGGRPARFVSERQMTVRGPAAASLPQFGARFDDGIVRRWLAGRTRNGSHGKIGTTTVLFDKKSRNGTSTVLDYGTSVGILSSPLNLTCQATDRRSTTTTPHAASDEPHRHAVPSNNWLGRQNADPIFHCFGNNGVGVTQRRSMSARADADERPSKICRRTCWSVGNITNDVRSGQPPEPSLLDGPTCDDAVQRRERSQQTPAGNSLCHNEASSWDKAGNSSQYIGYCSNVVAGTEQRMRCSSSSLAVQEHVQLDEPVPDRLLVDPTWSRLRPSHHDVGLRHAAAASGHAAPPSECSVVGPEPVATDDDNDDDDALRQLLRLIQQPDGQPVFLCRHCDIVYADRMLYALHMGLHNVNNPWQCNICGTTCSGRQQFALHALHY